MLRMYASNPHSYTHLILALGIVREPAVWVFITSNYPGIHDFGLPIITPVKLAVRKGATDSQWCPVLYSTVLQKEGTICVWSFLKDNPAVRLCVRRGYSKRVPQLFLALV